jgi:parvulin-like peptidyl-prolyl isomerase
MTIKAKPTTRVRRDHPDRGERRNLYMTIGFGGAIVLAVLILVAAVFATWYGEHNATMFSVNGESVSRDAFRNAEKVGTWKLDYQESILRERVQRGELEATDADQQITALQQQRSSVPQEMLTTMQDGTLALQIARDKGVSPTSEQIDKAIAAIGEQPESRRSFLITVAPATSGGTTSTSTDVAAAEQKAKDLHAKLVAGTKWEDVVKEASGDASNPDGAIGLITKESTRVDPLVRDAIMAAASNSITDVVSASDGSFQIARVTDVYPASTDPNVVEKAKAAGVDEGSLRLVASYEAVKDSLRGAVLGPILYEASPQRDVDRIVLNVTGGTGDAVKVRHILVSPNNDPGKAGSLKPDDPAWKAAADEADKLAAEIKAGTRTFADGVSQSDDTGSAAQGGELGWFTRGQIVPEFGDAIFADGLTAGQILGPVKTAYGYHIIEYEGRRPPTDQLIDQLAAEAAKPGADFRALATQYSDASDAPSGGSMGWVARFQLPLNQEGAIFAAPVGGVSSVVRNQDAYYLFKVNTEETRKAEGDQYNTLVRVGYDNWFGPQRDAAKIQSDATPEQVLGTATPAP